MGYIVRISGWRDGLQKVSMTKSIRAMTDLGLKDSKACTERVLEGEVVELAIDDSEVAVQLARRLDELGAEAQALGDPT